MKKYCKDLKVNAISQLNDKYILLKLTDSLPLPEMLPGQFVEVKVEDSPNTFLRRPISINNVDAQLNEMHLLIAVVGDGTRHLASLKPGDTLNVMFPLGKGFSMPAKASDLPAGRQARHLLIGGGVGVAPLLYLGKKIKEQGATPTFLLGARTAADLLMLNDFRQYGDVYVTTEDGSEGERGFVTNHSILQKEHFDMISTCGPGPMMAAVARMAKEKGIRCEVSLENKMACGLGACLCCVEKTRDKGNVCVCTEGPIFDAEKLFF